MPTYGPNPGTVAINRGSGVAWANPTFILLNDGSSASGSFGAPGDVTQDLVVTTFNFAIPGAEYIVGVQIAVKGNQGIPGGTINDTLTLQKDSAGSPVDVGTPQNSTLFTFGAPVIVTYGSALSTFGAALTPAIANNTNFGFSLRASIATGNPPLGLLQDYATITITTSLTPPTIFNNLLLSVGVG